ncbi:RNA methyltransferase [[Eubacterium] cellulosolvens]
MILLEPKHEGNIGAVARCIKNFGYKDLYLVKPCELGDECLRRAKHAKDVVQNAKTFDSLSQAQNEIDILVGSSGVLNLNDKHHIRNPITPRQFVGYAKQMEHGTRLGLLFGREDYGLYQDELLHCDLLMTIPTNEEYPIMNLSHAVAIILYELAAAELTFNIRGHRKTSKFEREKLFEQFRSFLAAVDYPAHKREHTEVLFRRLLGRATPSKWEFHTLMGVFGRASNKLKKTSNIPKKK